MRRFDGQIRTLAELIRAHADLRSTVLTRLTVAARHTVWVPAAEFKAGLGSPTYGVIGSWAAMALGWSMTDADTRGIIGHTMCPPDWRGGTVTASVLFQGNGSGNFRIGIQMSDRSPGDPGDLMQDTDNASQTKTVAAYNGTHLEPFASAPLTIAEGDYINMAFFRVGADAADTSTNTLVFFGVRLDYTPA